MAKAKLTLDKLFEGTFLVDLLTAKDNCPNEHVSRGGRSHRRNDGG